VQRVVSIGLRKILFLWTLTIPLATARATDIITHHYDTLRTGWNQTELSSRPGVWGVRTSACLPRCRSMSKWTPSPCS
jgi:hypothetical protein